jgi:hypothetical protein
VAADVYLPSLHDYRDPPILLLRLIAIFLVRLLLLYYLTYTRMHSAVRDVRVRQRFVEPRSDSVSQSFTFTHFTLHVR